MASTNERCTACGSARVFVGFDRTYARVTRCVANLTMKAARDSETTMVPCDEDFFIRGMRVKNPMWMQEREEVSAPREFLVRCRNHGMEWARMKPRKKERDS